MTAKQRRSEIPAPVTGGPSVAEAQWFRRMPTGGTAYGRVAPVEYFRQAPNGGGTVYMQPSDSGNPHARIDEDPEAARPVVTVERPPIEEIRVLDACCRKGGSSYGYKLAGFHVVGVDELDCADGYAGDEFVQGDAIEFIKAHGHEFHLLHGGPPCQGQIQITKGNRQREGWVDNHVNLIPDMRSVMESTGRPYVIENGPSEHIRPDLTLCGLMFGLPTMRHRSMELGGWSVPQPELPSHRGHLTLGWRHGCLRTAEPSVCPKHDRWCKGTVYGVYGKGGGKPSVAEAQRALGIDWMSRIEDLNEAVPPAYTAFLGREFAAHLLSAA